MSLIGLAYWSVKTLNTALEELPLSSIRIKYSIQDPTDPAENEDPSDKKNPLEDTSLGAFEHSIEKPPAFTESPAEKDEVYMDNPAKQLDKVESSIENALPLQVEPELIEQEVESDVCDNETATSVGNASRRIL